MNKVKDFVSGDAINQPLLVGMVNQGVTTSGSPYLSLSLQDVTGTIDAKYWSVKPDQEALCQSGKIIQVVGDVISYKGHLQLKIAEVSLPQGELDPMDFRMSAPIDKDLLHKDINDAVASLKDEVLKKVVTQLLNDAGESFYSRPAAVKNHHEFDGGLATHVVSMLKLAQAVLPLYPVLDHDLLIAGVLVHDIGKLKELSGGVVPEYTFEGKLLGHISIGNAMIMEAATKLGLQDKESVILLEHMVLSHHGEYEFGSPMLPMTPEAEALHFIDNFDARMEMLRKAMDNTKKGEFTIKLYPLENRMFYKPNK